MGAEGPNKRDASDLYDQPLEQGGHPDDMGGIKAMENNWFSFIYISESLKSLVLSDDDVSCKIMFKNNQIMK